MFPIIIKLPIFAEAKSQGLLLLLDSSSSPHFNEQIVFVDSCIINLFGLNVKL